jgi:hypothetical protein
MKVLHLVYSDIIDKLIFDVIARIQALAFLAMTFKLVPGFIEALFFAGRANSRGFVTDHKKFDAVASFDHEFRHAFVLAVDFRVDLE